MIGSKVLTIEGGGVQLRGFCHVVGLNRGRYVTLG